MLELLKIIHFIGIIMGIGAGMANMLAGRGLAGVPRDAMPIVGRFRQGLGKMSTLGLILLWISGIILVKTQGGADIIAVPAFKLKLAAVVVLTGFSIAANYTVFQAKRAGSPPDAERMKKISLGAMIFGLLALAMAVFAFTGH